MTSFQTPLSNNGFFQFPFHCTILGPGGRLLCSWKGSGTFQTPKKANVSYRSCHLKNFKHVALFKRIETSKAFLSPNFIKTSPSSSDSLSWNFLFLLSILWQTPVLPFQKLQKNFKIFQDLSLNQRKPSPFPSLSSTLTQMASAIGHATRSNKYKEIPLATNVNALQVENNQVHAP